MKFSEFWDAVLRFYEQDNANIECILNGDTLKEDYRGLWYDGLDPEEAYLRLS